MDNNHQHQNGTASKTMEKKVAVIGGGLVGSMVSCFLADRGFQVDVYEMREDIRLMEHVQGKSINLAISERGRSALRALGLEEEVLDNHAIPMRARLIHDLSGKKRIIPYGRSDQKIYSVGRRFINELLLNHAERKKNVSIHFNYKTIGCDFDQGKTAFTKSTHSNSRETNSRETNSRETNSRETNSRETNSRENCDTPFVIGCDGAFSAVRRSMMKVMRMNFSQTYIEHGYIELNIPPTKEGDFAMEVNYLHIWPRDEFMMIALPNQDKSWTVTLFMPFEHFQSIKDKNDLLTFFDTYFPDSIPLIGEETLVNDFFSIQPSPLISIKCQPLNYKDRALIIGDAAHAMVPFFGQGMNCGFEDCLVLNELLIEHGNDLGQAIERFSKVRNEDCHVICDLAMYNYIEMRHLVNSIPFLIRKKLDSCLHSLFPLSWIPLYSMVTFSRIPYSKVIEKRNRQDQIIKSTMFGLLGLTLVFASRIAFKSLLRSN